MSQVVSRLVIRVEPRILNNYNNYITIIRRLFRRIVRSRRDWIIMIHNRYLMNYESVDIY